MRAEVVAAFDDRVEVRFALDPGDPVRTSHAPDMVQSLREHLPGLERHSCTSPPSGLLVSELADTELAHLFEHVTLELMVLSGSPRTLAGSTDWDFARDGTGVFRVTIGCDDVHVAAAAVGEALRLLEALVDGAPTPAPDATAARLAAIRTPSE